MGSLAISFGSNLGWNGYSRCILECSAYQQRVNNSSTQTEQDYWQGLLDRTNNNIATLNGWYSNDSTFDALIGWMVRMPVYDEIIWAQKTLW